MLLVYCGILTTTSSSTPEADPATVRFAELHNWIVALPGFDDDNKRGGGKVLEAIQQAWIDEAE